MPDEEREDLSVQRMMDLIRHQRNELHEAGLITDGEFALLAQDHAAVARLEDYATLRKERTAKTVAGWPNWMLEAGLSYRASLKKTKTVTGWVGSIVDFKFEPKCTLVRFYTRREDAEYHDRPYYDHIKGRHDVRRATLTIEEVE